MEVGGPVFCMVWNRKRKQLVAGGNAYVHFYKVSTQGQPWCRYSYRQPPHDEHGEVVYLLLYMRQTITRSTGTLYCCGAAPFTVTVVNDDGKEEMNHLAQYAVALDNCARR